MGTNLMHIDTGPWNKKYTPFDAIGFPEVTLNPPPDEEFTQCVERALLATYPPLLSEAGVDAKELSYNWSQVREAADFLSGGFSYDDGKVPGVDTSVWRRTFIVAIEVRRGGSYVRNWAPERGEYPRFMLPNPIVIDVSMVKSPQQGPASLKVELLASANQSLKVKPDVTVSTASHSSIQEPSVVTANPSQQGIVASNTPCSTSVQSEETRPDAANPTTIAGSVCKPPTTMINESQERIASQDLHTSSPVIDTIENSPDTTSVPSVVEFNRTICAARRSGTGVPAVRIFVGWQKEQLPMAAPFTMCNKDFRQAVYARFENNQIRFIRSGLSSK
jgi:hypothetical protein